MRLCGGRETLWSELAVLRSLFRDLSPNPRIAHCRFSLEALGLCCRCLCLNGPAASFPLTAAPSGGAGGSSLKSWGGWGEAQVPVGSRDHLASGSSCPPLAPTQTSMEANPGKTLPPGPAHTDGSVSHPQCAGEEDWVDSRTVYVGHREPPPGTEAYIPQRYPDNRIVSSKVSVHPGLPREAPRALRAP